VHKKNLCQKTGFKDFLRIRKQHKIRDFLLPISTYFKKKKFPVRRDFLHFFLQINTKSGFWNPLAVQKKVHVPVHGREHAHENGYVCAHALASNKQNIVVENHQKISFPLQDIDTAPVIYRI
jgi:hypothetical protein